MRRIAISIITLTLCLWLPVANALVVGTITNGGSAKTGEPKNNNPNRYKCTGRYLEARHHWEWWRKTAKQDPSRPLVVTATASTYSMLKTD